MLHKAKKININIIVFLYILVLVFVVYVVKPYSKAEEKEGIENNDLQSDISMQSDSDEITQLDNVEASLNVCLYDTAEYSQGGNGTNLTESGITVSGWQYGISKYLEIRPEVPHDGRQYVISVSTPQELYFVTQKLTAPTGFDSVTFEKNANIMVNKNGTYAVNNYSGTAYLKMANGITNATLQLEIAYDTYLWNKMANALITSPNVNPLEVKLLYVDNNGEYVEIENKCINKAISGTELKKTYQNNFYGNGIWNQTTVSDEQTFYYYLGLSTSTVSTYFYYKEIEFDISLPYYTDSKGEKTYLSYNLSNFTTTYDYTIDESDAINGNVKITCHNFYGTSFLFWLNGALPESLAKTSIKTFAFKGGTIKWKALNKEDNFVDLSSKSLSNVTINTLKEENVTLSATGLPNMQTGLNDDRVTQLGYFNISNIGNGDSEAKNINIVFDSNNTGYIKITTMTIPISRVDEYITVTYTLVDENNQEVYIDGKNEWTYTFKNSYYGKSTLQNTYFMLYRGLLPTEQRGYFFKTLDYTVSSFPSGAQAWANQSTRSYSGGGLFYGYVVTNDTTAKIPTTMTITSANCAILTKTATTSITTAGTTAFGVSEFKANNMDKASITAGSSVACSGSIVSINYPYGNTLFLQDIIIGVVLPTGVSLNEESLLLWGKNASNKFCAEKIETVDLNNGCFLYKIYVPSNVYIGYATEKVQELAVGRYLYFSFQLNTSYYLGQQTINFKDCIFAASSSQTNAASGSYTYYSYTDVYDINGNNKLNDKIGGINNGTSIVRTLEITPQNATFNISDQVSVTSNGNTTANSSEIKLNTKDDIINYILDLDCTSGGSVEEFMYYIQIPKKSSTVDGFFIKSGENSNKFDMQLNDKISVSGDDLYNFYYTTDSGLSYSNVKNNSINWYTSDEIDGNDNINYEDVTIIKIVPKSSVIENGSQTFVNVKIKYKGTTYDEEAGNNYTWHSAGSFRYLLGGREMSGNFSTTGVKAKLSFNTSLEDVTLTVAQNMEPKETNNVREYTTTTTDIPEFVNSHNFSITNIETYNVVLRTKEYINSNINMEGVYANSNFAITVSLNNKAEKNALDTASENSPISIGNMNANSVPIFTYRIYNANALSDNSQTRYIILTLTSDNGVTIKQKINITTELAKAEDPESAIVAGKRYIEFDSSSKNVEITSDSSFTAQFVLKYIPDLYSGKALEFKNNLPINTNITILNKIGNENPTYWYYKVEREASEFELTKFSKMGTDNIKDYSYPTGTVEINEILLVIVDFVNCADCASNINNSVKLKLNGVNNVQDIFSDEMIFDLKNKRTFTMNIDKGNVNFGESAMINYSSTEPNGTESMYSGKKLSIVLTANDAIPTDTCINVGNTEYKLNANQQFIIPLENIQGNVDGNILITFNSKTLPKEASNYKFKVELWASATSNASAPLSGEKKVEKEIIVNNTGKINPALKVIKMDTRIIKKENLSDIQNINILYKSADNCNVYVELQKKEGAGYQKVTDKLIGVNGSTIHTVGVYSVNAIDGENNVSVRFSNSIEMGTYRMLFTVKNLEGDIILEVPYNFIVIL